MVWFPFNNISLLLRSLTAIPSLSPSGSVPITISACFSSASFIAISSASGSSGFGDLTVGKSPFGSACSFTIKTLVYPAFSRTCGFTVDAVPCNEVKTIFRSFRASAEISELPFLTEASRNALSTLASIFSIRSSFALKLISLNWSLLISSITILSWGGTSCPPSCQ